MKRNVVISVFTAAWLVLAIAGSALAADGSAAMKQHMRLMADGNPGMERMMELMNAGNPGMGRMMEAPPFHMPPVHP
jgi:hypothetical protein